MNELDFMVEAIPNPVHGADSPRRHNAWLAPILPFFIAFAATAACHWAAGATLGLFIGGLSVAALVTAPLVHGESSWLGRALCVFGTIHGIAVVWLYAAIKIDLDLGAFCAAYLALATFVMAIAGLTVLLRRLGWLAAALTTLLAVAWMTWPLWLSPVLRGSRGERIVSWLVPAHPLFAANGVLRSRLGYWAEQGIAYHYTTIQDDIAYALPGTVLQCILLHSGIAAGCVLLAWRIDRPKRLPTDKDSIRG